MKLLEFITYCTLKGLVVEHRRLDNEWHAKIANKQRLMVENDSYFAVITYTHFAGKHNILAVELSKVSTHSDELIAGADFRDVLQSSRNISLVIFLHKYNLCKLQFTPKIIVAI